MTTIQAKVVNETIQLIKECKQYSEFQSEQILAFLLGCTFEQARRLWVYYNLKSQIISQKL